IVGGSGVDAIDCGPGEDSVIYNLNSELDRMSGCENRIKFESGINARTCGEGGTDAAEALRMTTSGGECFGRGGDDDLEGSSSRDTLRGGDGFDGIFGRTGDDRLYGGPGDDEIQGGRGEDYIRGESGDDYLNGGFDPDRLYGGSGNNVIVAVGGGRDVIDCGPGLDRVYADRSDSVRSDCERVYRNRTAPSPPRRAERGDLGQVACALATGGGREAVIACLESL
ncbi:MAG: calcium-binding protein, partial [Solirubrobacteraceae bacterium]